MERASDKDLLERIERLNAIGMALSVEQDLNRLLEMILLGAKELTGADGGSLYILDNRLLKFTLIHTTSLKIHMGGTSHEAIKFPPIPLDDADGRPNLKMVVTRAVIEERIINIPDAYADSEYDFSGTRKFDAKTGYHSQSLLAVPMVGHEGKIIGVLQLINATDRESGQVKSFSAMDESLVSSLTSQASISLTRKRLIDGLEELLQSLVKLIATAIDDKSSHTGGHCRRVPSITMGLALAVNEDTGPLFGDVSFTDQQLKELEMAAWLHDCGKITTPESVVDKETRLKTIFDRVHLVDARLEILRRDQSPEKTAVSDEEHPPAIDVDEVRAFIHACNAGSTLIDDTARRRLAELAKIKVRFGNRSEGVPLLSENELYNLSIENGTLTREEREIINSHVEASIRMLDSLPFPEHLQMVPEIAGGHHERMDGKGYPLGVPAAELSLQTRILAIADIFEAMTASDRVYRKPNTISESLRLMVSLCLEGHLDPQLLELFIRRQAYRGYAEESLLAEQIDEVDAESLVALLHG